MGLGTRDSDMPAISRWLICEATAATHNLDRQERHHDAPTSFPSLTLATCARSPLRSRAQWRSMCVWVRTQCRAPTSGPNSLTFTRPRHTAENRDVRCASGARSPLFEARKKHRVRIVDCDIAFSRFCAYRLLIEQLDRILFEDPRMFLSRSAALAAGLKCEALWPTMHDESSIHLAGRMPHIPRMKYRLRSRVAPR